MGAAQPGSSPPVGTCQPCSPSSSAQGRPEASAAARPCSTPRASRRVAASSRCWASVLPPCCKASDASSARMAAVITPSTNVYPACCAGFMPHLRVREAGPLWHHGAKPMGSGTEQPPPLQGLSSGFVHQPHGAALPDQLLVHPLRQQRRTARQAGAHPFRRLLAGDRIGPITRHARPQAMAAAHQIRLDAAGQGLAGFSGLAPGGTGTP